MTVSRQDSPEDGSSFFSLHSCGSSSEICVPAKGLLEKIDPDGIEGFSPNSVSHQIRKSVAALRRSGISVTFRKSNGERLICLRRVDRVDDSPIRNIVPYRPC